MASESSLKWNCSNCSAVNTHNIECNSCTTSASKDYIDKVISNTKELLNKHGQSQVLSYINDISSNSDLNKLLSQIYSIDFDEINNLHKRAISEEKARQDADAEEKKQESKTNMEPFPHSDAFNINSIGDINKLCNLGFKSISSNECSVIILAGGQGTRLGFNKPKGCYPIGAISSTTIYQTVLEKMMAVKRAARNVMKIPDDKKIYFPIFFMTSEATHPGTLDFLEKNKYFGYDKSDVILFKQKLFPCLEEKTGKFIMKSACEIAMSPNGNGGIYSSLILNGIFDNMCNNGIKYTQIFGIDNILARIGDPLWFGHMIESQCDASNKTCIKKEAHEKVGVMCLKNSKPFVTEYTELTKEMVELKQKDKNELEYCYGNLAMHMFSIEFLKKICYDKTNKYSLPIHIARKQIPCYNSEKKETIKPKDKNGIKLEFFVFDTYQYSQKCTVYNILRNEEFAPVKNKNEVGKDSPLTATIAHSNYWKQQIIKCGGKFDNNNYNNDEVFVEVSPLFGYLPYGYGYDEFKKRVNGKSFTLPFYFN